MGTICFNMGFSILDGNLLSSVQCRIPPFPWATILLITSLYF
uniref:Uncharacterized protein n=1 Tax=Arundo donax TaxID=35708 RepID=A0A0A9C3Z6_ARUDO